MVGNLLAQVEQDPDWTWINRLKPQRFTQAIIPRKTLRDLIKRNYKVIVCPAIVYLRATSKCFR